MIIECDIRVIQILKENEGTAPSILYLIAPEVLQYVRNVYICWSPLSDVYYIITSISC